MTFFRLRRGQAEILIAGIIVVFLLVFFVVGIDFARIYYIRGELQNAADSAALAGAKQLDGTNVVLQTDARQAAWKFACRNKAAKANVYLVSTGTDCNTPPSDLNNGNASTGDIVVGNWNPSLTPTFDSARIPVNAVRVVARRVGLAGTDSPGGSVGLLFGRLVGWSTIDVVRTATGIADLNIAPLPICLPPCNTAETPLTAPQSCSDAGNSNCFPGFPLCLGPSTTTNGLAWTNFQPQPQTGDCPSCGGGNQPTPGDIIPFINGTQPVPNVCGQFICTTNGGMGPAVAALEDRWQAEIQKHPDGFDIPGQAIKVKGWHTFLPVVDDLCPGTPHGACPGAPQPNPYKVVQYTEVVITYVGKVVGTDCNFGIKVVGFGSTAPSTPGVSLLGCGACDEPPFPGALTGQSRLVK
jgi:Flp pilus assembly protein TadG